MVQFYANSSSPSHSYWKLDPGGPLRAKDLRELLRERNFATLKSTSVARLKTLYIRSQRGLLSYEGLPLHELKRFAAQRALPAVVGQKKTIKVLKAQLEMADEEATFDRFLDLPPELRCLIYAFHFESFPSDSAMRYLRHVPRLKRQPPISFSCREVRREALPLFYGSCELEVKVNIPFGDVKMPFFKALDDTSAAFIKSTTTSNFARIRFLHLCFGSCRVGLMLDFTNEKDPIQVTFQHYTLKTRLDRILKNRKARMVLKLPRLRKIAIDIAARDGPLRLRKTDLKELYKSARGMIAALSNRVI